MSGRIIALAAAFVALVTLPYWMTGVYYVNVSSQILFYAIFALGLNILAGYGGLVSLGHAEDEVARAHGTCLPNRPCGRKIKTSSIGRNRTK